MPAKKPRHSLRLNRSLPQGQRLRQWRGAGLVQPAFHVIEAHLAAVVLDEMADEIVVQIDIERSCHALTLPSPTSAAASASS